MLLFKRDMAFIYPDGVTDKKQWRDICKIWIMGYITALHCNVGPCAELTSAMHYAKQMTDYNWYPDDEWKWW